VRGIIVTGDADLHDPACVRATMGALDALELVRTTPHELVALVRRSRGRLIGAAPDGAGTIARSRTAAPRSYSSGQSAAASATRCELPSTSPFASR